MRKNSIAILLATYNGEKYLKEQLDSIISQTNNKFDLFIRDDGSNDGTWKILKQYEHLYCNVHCLKNTSNQHGQLLNFSYLFSYVKKMNEYRYIMFSDQDDIWFPEKVEQSISKIKESSNEPSLLYTNYVVYDQNRNEKKIAYTKRYPEAFERIFVQNWLMGCTMVLNKKMIDKIYSIPKGTDNHDYWIALVASLNDNIIYLDKPTMLHRLHNGNVTTKSNKGNFERKVLRIFRILLSGKFRKSKYKMWDNVENELEKAYQSNHIDGLSEMLGDKGITAIKKAKKLEYQGMNRLSTMAFYTIIFFH